MSMELDHSFTVPVPPDQAWDVLLDVEKVAPCMPGAQVDTVEGDDVAGRLKVKVGSVSLTYKGTATFKDRDAADHSVLVEASGKEMRGGGTASATVRAALRPENGAPEGGTTLVMLHTTLNVTGRPAQFGRGVITEVGSRLIGKFAENLAQQLAGGAPAPEAAAAPSSAAAGRIPAAAAPAAAPSGTASPEAVPAAPARPDTASADGTEAPASTAEVPAAPAVAPVRDLPAPPVGEPMQPVHVEHRDDSLDLPSLVGPVILKRLAPLAAAAVAVGLLTWGARRLARRRRNP